MDWLKLFALLVAVASVVTAEGPKKKIRIHLPQKVKHIHHHKKVYITNHPAPSQYAPAYLPGVKGGPGLGYGRPRPYGSAEYEEQPRLPPVTPAASKLLPLYRARGHYGPNLADWDEQEYDLSPPPEPTDNYAPSAYAGPSAPSASSYNPPKRVKVVKFNEGPSKKLLKNGKPKRGPIRGRPLPPQQSQQADEEHPVSTYHEQFYSDLEEAGTIKKVRKPPRVEKIIDGDTEHIHTYTEEHIHKVVFDDDSKLTGVVGMNPVASMSALSAAHPLVPIKNAQALVAISSDSLPNLAVMGSLGTPSHMEYVSYNPRDVTHDHIFHDHGEIPSGLEITKEALRLPPKTTYNSHGLPIAEQGKWHHGKFPRPKPQQDFSYYENIYTNRPKKAQRPQLNQYEPPPADQLDNYKPIPAFRFKDKRKAKNRNPYGGKPNFQLQQASVPAPFTVSSTVVHEYENKNYPSSVGSGSASSGYAKFTDPLMAFKESFTGNDFDYDTFASSSNVYTSEDKNDSAMSLQAKPNKKSVSSQNINFGGHDHQVFFDNMGATSSEINDGAPSALENFEFDQNADTVSPTPFSIKETSPIHSYYTSMAMNSLNGEQPESSNDHAQYAEPPKAPTLPSDAPLATTTSHPPKYYKINSSDAITGSPTFLGETQSKSRRKEKNSKRDGQRLNNVLKELFNTVSGMSGTSVTSAGSGPGAYRSGGAERPRGLRPSEKLGFPAVPTTARGNPKYGDKI